MYIYIYIYIQYIRISVCICLFMHCFLHVYICIYTYACVCMSVVVYMRIYIYIYVCIYIYICIYVPWAMVSNTDWAFKDLAIRGVSVLGSGVVGRICKVSFVCCCLWADCVHCVHVFGLEPHELQRSLLRRACAKYLLTIFCGSPENDRKHIST